MDIKHVKFRPDGESDGEELCDIDLGNGYRECSNWNTDLTRRGDIEDIEKLDISDDLEDLKKEIAEWEKMNLK